MSRQATQRLSTTAPIGVRRSSSASPTPSTSPGSPTAAPARHVAQLRPELRRSADGASPVGAGSARELRAQSRTIARGERTSRTVRFRTEARRESLSPTKMGKTGRLKL